MMNKGEKQAILAAAHRIRELASLENAGFDPFHPGQDAYIKREITPYMGWFECVAEGLEMLAKAEDAYKKEFAIRYLQKYIV